MFFKNFAMNRLSNFLGLRGSVLAFCLSKKLRSLSMEDSWCFQGSCLDFAVSKGCSRKYLWVLRFGFSKVFCRRVPLGNVLCCFRPSLMQCACSHWLLRDNWLRTIFYKSHKIDG